jgi:hypothetical protein
VVIGLVVAAIVPRTAAHPAGVPTRLDAELDALGESVVFNSYELGGWLRWRHPELEPVVDGMTEAYSFGHLSTYGVAQAAAPGWREAFDNWSVDAALLSDDSSLTLALVEQEGWVILEQDAGYTLLIPGETPGE